MLRQAPKPALRLVVLSYEDWIADSHISVVGAPRAGLEDSTIRRVPRNGLVHDSWQKELSSSGPAHDGIRVHVQS